MEPTALAPLVAQHPMELLKMASGWPAQEATADMVFTVPAEVVPELVEVSSWARGVKTSVVRVVVPVPAAVLERADSALVAVAPRSDCSWCFHLSICQPSLKTSLRSPTTE